jgi:hypothetical protein
MQCNATNSIIVAPHCDRTSDAIGLRFSFFVNPCGLQHDEHYSYTPLVSHSKHAPSLWLRTLCLARVLAAFRSAAESVGSKSAHLAANQWTDPL